MNVHPDDPPSDLAFEAAEWVEKLSGDDGDLLQPAAERWCAQSAEHRKEFLLASLTSIQLDALRAGPYSSGLKGYRAPLHRWITSHFDEPEKLQDIADEVHARLVQLPAAELASDATGTLYSISLELASLSEPQSAAAFADRGASAAPAGKPPPQQRIAEAFDTALAELPKACRDVLLLCNRDRLTVEEAAQALGLSASTAKQNLTTARRAIAAKLLKR